MAEKITLVNNMASNSENDDDIRALSKDIKENQTRLMQSVDLKFLQIYTD